MKVNHRIDEITEQMLRRIAEGDAKKLPEMILKSNAKNKKLHRRLAEASGVSEVRPTRQMEATD